MGYQTETEATIALVTAAMEHNLNIAVQKTPLGKLFGIIQCTAENPDQCGVTAWGSQVFCEVCKGCISYSAITPSTPSKI